MDHNIENPFILKAKKPTLSCFNLKRAKVVEAEIIYCLTTI